MKRTRAAHRLRLASAVPITLLALALSACGSESDGDEADTRGEDTSQTPMTDPSGTGTPSSTSPSSSDPSGSVDFDEVAILHATAAGGDASAAPAVLDSQAAVDDFVAPFARGDLGEQVQSTYDATTVPDGKTMVGSVVAIGCDVPPGVGVSATDGLTITPKKVASPLPECLAPVTTVALVLVDSAALG